MLKQFRTYFANGIANTATHWGIFLVLTGLAHVSQSIANLIAFMAAVTLSFVLNARFTFNAAMNRTRYLLYVGFMGGLALLTGYGADRLGLPGVVTLVTFSAISLIAGFLYARYVVFVEPRK